MYRTENNNHLRETNYHGRSFDSFMRKRPHSSSFQSHNRLNSLTDAKKTKRGPSVKLFGDELCSICGRKADGFHYNVLSCQGCKGFFRRTILQNSEYVCRTGRGGCDLKDVDHARQRCQKCRIEKCYATGMLEKYVRRKKNRTRTMRILENMKRPSVIVKSYTPHETDLLTQALRAWRTATDTVKQVASLQPLFKRIHELNSLVGPEQAKQLKISSYFIIKLSLLVRFCKELKLFDEYSIADKVTILSKTMVELFVLHTWPKYNAAENSVTTFDGSEINSSRLIDAGATEEFVDDVFNLLQNITKLKLTDEAIGILCCLTVFSPDRDYAPDLAERLNQTESEYSNMLVRYVQRNYAFKRNYTARLLGLLPKLRYFAEGSLPKHAKAVDVFSKLAPPLIQRLLETNNLVSCLDRFIELMPANCSLVKTETPE